MTAAYFDTNIIIDFFAGHPPAKTVMEKFTVRKCPAVAYIEFMTGIDTPQKKAQADEVIHALFEIVQTDMDTCREAVTLRRKTRLKLPDAMVYGAARAGGGILVTRDRDFDPRWPDVYVPYE